MILTTSSVDLEGITSSVSRSLFDESELEYLANLFLKSGDTVSPILLREKSPIAFEVLEGHREYYAALKAQELDSRFESIRAYIVPSDREESIVEQYEYFHSPDRGQDGGKDSGIDQKLLVSTIDQLMAKQINPLKSGLQDVNAKLDQKVVSPQVSTAQQSIAPPEIGISNSIEQQLAELTQTIKNLDQRIPPLVTQVSNMLEELNTLSKENLEKKLEKIGVKGVLLKSLVSSVCNGRPYESFKDIISRKESSGKKKIFTDAGLIKLLEIKVLDLW
jgi:ParB family chromosome partitioning protein